MKTRKSASLCRIVCMAFLLLLLSNALTNANAGSKKIAIDPGHGGTDSGAVGPTGVNEKDVNLQIALKLRAKLEAQGYTVVMTRTTDTEVNKPPKDLNGDGKIDQSDELQARCNKANEANADIFVSIHCNAAENSEAKGTETYYYSGSTKGEKLATEVQGELVEALDTNDRGVKEGTFYVLKNTKMPAILTEVAFISNPDEEAMLNEEETQETAAQAIKDGIDTYFSVGGIVVPVDKFGLLAPYIGLASTTVIAAVVTAVCVKRRKEKQ